MTESEEEPLAAFVQHVVRQLEKNGYPDRKVAFPIERLYDSAYAKGLNFNKVLEALEELGIGHEKTPEKVVFVRVEVAAVLPDISELPDMSTLEGMSKDELMAAAAAAMEQLGPERLAAMRAMIEGMTPEQQAAMLEQARKLGLG